MHSANQPQGFASYLRVVGRGPTLSRPLDQAEAQAAMRLILAGEARPVQVGGFLMVLRYRGETAGELAGFVRAARRHIRLDGPVAADLDWPSYADRHRQQPWFALAALLLAESGYRVLMHGIAGARTGCAPTRPVLQALGVPLCHSVTDANASLASRNFAYIGLEHLCPPINALFGLRDELGVRTVVNTLARALNPAEATHQIQGVFHPPYRALHQEAALLLGQKRAAIFKGGGGEAQRNPLKPCAVTSVRDGEAEDQEWPALLPNLDYRWRDEDLDTRTAVAIWRGECETPAPIAAITGTTAVALHLLGRAKDPAQAQAMAEAMWRERPRHKYATAA